MSDSTRTGADLDALRQRLDALEAEKHVRQCMNRYMALCDRLDEGFELDDLMALFSADAVWQGKGQRYAKTFGAYEGREAIREMFARYTKPPAHFALNAHFLCNELIDVDVAADAASGSWMLIQPSTFASGDSQLSCARISASFIRHQGRWVIDRFVTENLFSRPLSEPWDSPAPLAVPSAEENDATATAKST